jgi:hypothetical protein
MRLILFTLLVLAVQGTSQQRTGHTVLVADPYYWPWSEGNIGIEITGKFQSEQGLLDTLNLTRDVGLFKDKKYPVNPRAWKLRDILISADFNATGSVAKWQVSGPRPLLLSYLASLQEQYESRSTFYDFGYRFIEFRPSTD